MKTSTFTNQNFTTFNEQDVQVTSVRFRHDSSQVRFESYPRRIVYRGREYVLA